MRAKTSSDPLEHEDASGPDLKKAPTRSQGCQPDPSQERCHSAPSAPRPNTSSRLAEATIEGLPVITPPRDSHGAHWLPSHERCHRALLDPTATRSRRFWFIEATSGSEMFAPPRRGIGMTELEVPLSEPSEL